MNWHEYFMRHVYLAASKSKDPKTKIGAVIVKDDVMVSEGYNGFPRKVLDSPNRYQKRDFKYQLVVHGEHNAILNCARHGISTLGSTLYTQGLPCNECAKAIIQAGVSTIVVHLQWPNLTHSTQWVESINVAKLMLSEANISCQWFDQTLGLQGLLDGKIVYV